VCVRACACVRVCVRVCVWLSECVCACVHVWFQSVRKPYIACVISECVQAISWSSLRCTSYPLLLLNRTKQRNNSYSLIKQSSSDLRPFGERSAMHCNTLQHAATRCNTLQHTATDCNTLQHTATYCNTLQRAATHRPMKISDHGNIRKKYWKAWMSWKVGVLHVFRVFWFVHVLHWFGPGHGGWGSGLQRVDEVRAIGWVCALCVWVRLLLTLRYQCVSPLLW